MYWGAQAANKRSQRSLNGSKGLESQGGRSLIGLQGLFRHPQELEGGEHSAPNFIVQYF